AETADAERRAAAERAAGAGERLAAARARADALRARLAEDETRPIARAARQRGGRLLDDGLEVEAGLRLAVEAALGDAARAYLVARAAVGELAGERGALVVAETAEVTDARGARPTTTADAHAAASGPAARLLLERVAEAGGGALAEAVRRDPTGAVRRLLARVAWLPELAAALELQADLPLGWLLVTRDGAVLAATGTISLGRAESRLERRAEAERLAGEAERLAAAEHGAAALVAAADTAARAARAELDAARAAESQAATARRSAEDEERRAGRETEAAAREAAWHAAQAERLEADRDRLAAAVAALEAAEAGRAGPAGEEPAGGPEGDALRGWETRAAELRTRRDRLAGEEAEQERTRRAAEERRARAAAAVALDEDRLGRADREVRELDERERRLTVDREALDAELAAATARERDARAALDELRAADAADRDRLAAAESAAAAARERLRAAEERTRAAEMADVEARLGLDAVREQTLVELAGLGDLGLRLLADAGAPAAAAAVELEAAPAGGPDDGPEAAAEDELLGSGSPEAGAGSSTVLEAALAELAGRWAAEAPPDVPPPTRLASLRRRFHELGAANPFAVEEHRELRDRLGGLEAQRDDLVRAMAQTRGLIEELNGLIAGQFRATFRALETAFDERFRALFGGGFARLSLTEPDDLSATGVEIVARPPGKKAQALSMLSGGERALTAVALLFAMLEVRPVPFCVLDEVDAALDEANVGRFADSLRALAAATQFIVITHNRGTIEAADALYGVTIGDDAVSRVISLRLEEAQALADRARPRDALTTVG
ncbi:MAG TPA: hypothetical protein VF763_12555, partial [Candidatus Limnocylindrales bacterium]